ncbi:glycerophosphodiester phosphodiesterase [Streptococcus porcinus]
MTTIFAHRGSKTNRPENTLAAFREAIRVGTDGIELDVHQTKDCHLVVIHDESVDRTTNGYGYIRDLLLKEIKELDAGSWFDPVYFREKVPTLEEVLKLLVTENFQGTLNIEIKTNKYHYPGIEWDIARLMKTREWPFNYLYCSFNVRSLRLMAIADPHIELAILVRNNPLQICIGRRTSLISAFHPKKFWIMTSRRMASYFGKTIRPWTLNNEKQMEYAFRLNLAGFMTDKPELAVRVRDRIINEKAKEN